MRTLEQLKNSNDILSGAESQRLRTFCTSEYLNVNTDLSDPLGQLLKRNNLDGLKKLIESREEVKEELFQMRWGPTKVPVYNVVLITMELQPTSREARLETVLWLVHEAHIGVDGVDLSGTSALMHSISTKPYLDTDFAQLMLDGGGDINKRTRYGGTTAHEISQVWPGQDEQRAARALRWFVEHGGDVEIKDGDGISPKFLISKQARLRPILAAALQTDGQTGNGGPSPSTAAGIKKVGRNDKCPCESGKKFKVCCGKA